MGDKTFFEVLRRWAYPTPEMEKITDGRQCRFATTDELLKIAENISGKKLDWFFEVYLRHPKLPVLNVERDSNKVLLQWETENHLPFSLPVEVKRAGKIVRIDMTSNKGEFELPQNEKLIIDPNEWILMDKINFVDKNKN